MDSPVRLLPSGAQAEVAKAAADAQPGPTSTFFHDTVLKLAEQEVAFLSEQLRDQGDGRALQGMPCAACTAFKRRSAQCSQKAPCPEQMSVPFQIWLEKRPHLLLHLSECGYRTAKVPSKARCGWRTKNSGWLSLRSTGVTPGGGWADTVPHSSVLHRFLGMLGPGQCGCTSTGTADSPFTGSYSQGGPFHCCVIIPRVI